MSQSLELIYTALNSFLKLGYMEEEACRLPLPSHSQEKEKILPEGICEMDISKSGSADIKLVFK